MQEPKVLFGCASFCDLLHPWSILCKILLEQICDLQLAGVEGQTDGKLCSSGEGGTDGKELPVCICM